MMLPSITGAVVNGAGGSKSVRTPLVRITTAAALSTALAPPCLPIADNRFAMSFSASTIQSDVAGEFMEDCLASMLETNSFLMAICRLNQAAA
jgi:hypothetical protein